jgi:hypothetical protein
VDATPWLVGSGEGDDEASLKKPFDRLKPFKDRVPSDIRKQQADAAA